MTRPVPQAAAAESAAPPTSPARVSHPAAAAMPGSVPRFASAVIAGGALAAALAVSALVIVYGGSVFVDPAFLAPVLGLAAAVTLLQHFGVNYEWGRHRVIVNLDDVAVVIALLALPAPAVVLVAGLGTAGVVFWRQRGVLKSTFNVASNLIGGTAAWGMFTLASAVGAPAVLAALSAVPVFLFTSTFLVATVLSRFENTTPWRVYRERFLVPGLVLSLIGCASGLVLIGLWTLHPVAIIGFAPFVYAARRHAHLLSRADRELVVHRRLASVTHDLVGTSDMDAVSDRVLDACEQLVDAGGATLRAEDESGTEREWTRLFDSGPAHTRRGHVQVLPGKDGRALGTLTLHPRAGTNGFTDTDREAVRILANAVGAALENVRALKDLEHAREEALQTQAALSKQEKLSTLGTLVAGVAHEINNPLTYMKGSLELAVMDLDEIAGSDAENAEDVGRVREDVQVALEGVERLQEITQSLKRVAKPAGANRQAADLNDIAREVAAVVRAGFRRGVTLEAALDPGPLTVNVNNGEITQIVLNLVKNAAEALGEEGGRVTVRTEREGDAVKITVEDDGPGIPGDVRARLFEPFFTTKEKGTGLGLHISHRIARDHGGDLACESTVGEGTTFTLTLPVPKDA